MKLLLSLLIVPLLLFAQEDTGGGDPWKNGQWDDDAWQDESSGTVWNGFVGAGFGTRLAGDSLIVDDNTLEDLRLRVESEWQPGILTLSLKADVDYDGIENDFGGDIRDLTAAFTLGTNTDFRIGRQVQTWGTGDLVFLNDLFPKDFVSFFAGRDDDYLKSPGDAIRITHYMSAFNIDFVWTPVFEADVYLTGERFSFFSPSVGENVTPRPPLSAVRPARSLSNGEFSLRLFRTVKGRETALYVHHGYFKQPTALTQSLQPTFAPLSALGASVRQPFGRGLLNIEGSYYVSRDDSSGANPLVPNDQARLLAGYEWEPKSNFTAGLQYYLEWTLDHDALIRNSPFPQFEPDEFRHVLTNRLTYRVARDRHTFSLFTFLSPSDRDFHLRPAYRYRRDDNWSVTVGGNLFGGDKPHTFFNQLRDASNAYLRIRYSY